ncbi:fatty acid desaturase [Paraburkholderia sp. JPY465]|uniref:fatty acid desaturase n=1 Tax=Paraburkholderia sp. JPY465 TaxID=3042285 RepID=UPI003D1D690D
MAHYLDDAQREPLLRRARSWLWRSEWPTWLLIVAVHASWFGIALHARQLGLPATTVLLALATTWYTSLQHELVHGHPTRWPVVNAIFGIAPLAVWFPYPLYRAEHLRHHDDERLTSPDDPESYFMSSRRWRATSAPMQTLLRFRNTFVGRIATGPAFAIAGVLTQACRRISAGDRRELGTWIAHLGLLALLLVWLERDCGIGPLRFLAGVTYPALSLGAVRSFREHRPAVSVAERSVINESGWLWRMLFLNNNYHLVHHDLPGVPWFALRRAYLDRRDHYCARNGHFVVDGYWRWFAEFGFRCAEPVQHPLDAAMYPATEVTRHSRDAAADPAHVHPPYPGGLARRSGDLV